MVSQLLHLHKTSLGLILSYRDANDIQQILFPPASLVCGKVKYTLIRLLKPNQGYTVFLSQELYEVSPSAAQPASTVIAHSSFQKQETENQE